MINEFKLLIATHNLIIRLDSFNIIGKKGRYGLFINIKIPYINIRDRDRLKIEIMKKTRDR